jgi:FO synthase
LKAGVNDVGGTLMNESITRSAGAVHGQEMTRHDLSSLVEARGRVPRQRTTLYGTPTPERLAAHEAPPSRRSARIALQPVPHRS